MLPYEDSISKAETDILIEGNIAHNLELGARGTSRNPGRNRRNTDPITLDIDDITTQVPSGQQIIHGGTVRLIENTTIAQDLTFNHVEFYFDGNHIDVQTDPYLGTTLMFKNNSVLHATESGHSLITLTGAGELFIASSRVNGFLQVRVPTEPSNDDRFLDLTNVETEKAGGIGIGGGPLKAIVACYVVWADHRDLSNQYLLNWTNAAVPTSNNGIQFVSTMVARQSAKR